MVVRIVQLTKQLLAVEMDMNGVLVFNFLSTTNRLSHTKCKDTVYIQYIQNKVSVCIL